MKHQSLTALILAVAIGALFSGCIGLDLDSAHRNGKLSDSDYYRIKAQRESARRQQMLLDQQASEQSQNQILSDYSRGINSTPATPMFSTPFLPSRPKGVGIGDTPVQPERRPPSGFELDQIQKRQGVFTGKTQMGQDGKLWYEYRTLSGSTYWSLPQ